MARMKPSDYTVAIGKVRDKRLGMAKLDHCVAALLQNMLWSRGDSFAPVPIVEFVPDVVNDFRAELNEMKRLGFLVEAAGRLTAFHAFMEAQEVKLP